MSMSTQQKKKNILFGQQTTKCDDATFYTQHVLHALISHPKSKLICQFYIHLTANYTAHIHTYKYLFCIQTEVDVDMKNKMVTLILRPLIEIKITNKKKIRNV